MSNTPIPATAPPKMPWIAKKAMKIQMALMRKGWLKSMQEYVMIITTTGRKSGKQYSTPIGYLKMDDHLYGLTNINLPNWARNVKANGNVSLEIKGEKISAQAEIVSDEAEREKLIARYRQVPPKQFQRMMRVSAEATEDEIQQAFNERTFIRFTL